MKKRCPSKLLKLLKQAIQLYHSQKKSRIDSTVELRAVVRFPTLHLAWKKKAVFQKLVAKARTERFL